jgi:hypothetical protein
MTRALLLLWFGLAIGLVGLNTGAGQTPTPAPPGAPRPPAFPGANSGAAAPPAPAPAPAPAKPRPAIAQKPAAIGVNPKGKESQPEKTKIVAIFHGTGSFDEAMAEKLRPVLAKTFYPDGNTPGNPNAKGSDALGNAAALVKAIVQ